MYRPFLYHLHCMVWARESVVVGDLRREEIKEKLERNRVQEVGRAEGSCL